MSEEFELVPEPPSAAERENRINALVDRAAGLIGTLWDPEEGMQEQKPWTVCAKEARQASVCLQQAALLMEALAQEEAR